jgi:Glycogen recognition site of AMP-activated protein kinase
MNERVQRYLDGELRRDELTPEELREVATHEAVIVEARNLFKSIELPDLTAGVLARIQANDPQVSRNEKSMLRGIVRWLWTPRSIRLRPAYATLAAALLLLIMAIPRGETPDALPLPGKAFVQFRLDAPGAKSVRLAGNFTGWKPTYTLQEFAPGAWSALVPLDSGVYNYVFVVNEAQWLADPAAPAVADGFGGVNSRLSVLLPDER